MVSDLQKKEIDNFIENYYIQFGSRLTPGGIGHYPMPIKGVKYGHVHGDTWDKSDDQIYDEIEYCHDWLRKYAFKRKTINMRTGSYSMKHVIESKAREDEKCNGYIKNGCFIVAALMEGYQMGGNHDYNANFNMSFYEDGLTTAYKKMGYREKRRPNINLILHEEIL